MARRPRAGAPPPGLVPLTVVVVLIGLNLRSPVVGVPPLLTTIAEDLGLSAAVSALLISVPLACFALLSPAVGVLARRLGNDRTVLLGLLVLAAALAVRPLGGLGLLLGGTVAVGVAITIGNVLVPVLVRHQAGPRTPAVMAASTSSYGVGQGLATLVAVPLALVVGWRGSLAAPSVMALVAAVAWWVWMGSAARRELLAFSASASGLARGGGRPVAVAPRRWSDPWREAGSWWVAAYFGLQAALFYSAGTWLPAQLVDDAGLGRAAAGGAVSIFHLVGIIGTLAVPLMIRWWGGTRTPAIVIGASWALFFAGMLASATWWPLWMTLGGLAQGAGIGLALTLVAVRPADIEHGRHVSGMVQGVGYAAAAVSAILIGDWAQSSGSWSGPTLALLVGGVAMAAIGYFAGSARPLGERR